MVKGERVTISQDTKKSLAKMAKPFEKFDDCIKRVLDCTCHKETKKSEQNDDDVEEKP